MRISDTPVARFFEAFAHLSSSDDIPAQVAQFAETFMAAGPQGAQCVRNADFALALPKRQQLFRSFGCESTSLVSLSETQLDARFTMARTRWRMVFRREHESPKEALADSLFIVDTCAETPKIVFYLAHQDYMEILRNNGILPA